MNRIDSLIAEEIAAEDRAFLDELAHEPGYFKQAFAMFRGSTGWVSGLIMVVQAAMGLIGFWMAYRFFMAGDPVTQLRWGLPAMTLIVVGAMLKFSLMPVMQANRVLREVRRLELVLTARDNESR